MSLPPVLLDTDILSALLRGKPVVLARAKVYLAVHQRFTISLITRYEILRGLKTTNATRQTQIFEQFCARNVLLPVADDVILQAAEIYADLHRRGALIGDADILIAASALVHGLGVATNNERHFRRVSGLQVENWLK